MARVGHLQGSMKSGTNLPPTINLNDFPPLTAEVDNKDLDTSGKAKKSQNSSPKRKQQTSQEKKIWISSEEKIRKMEEQLRENMNKYEVKEEVKQEVLSETTTTNTTNKKLRDFPLVLTAIENAPCELLMDIHYLLYLSSTEVGKERDKILEFESFTFNSESDDYEERNDFLQRMTFKLVGNVARSFSVAVLSTKEETIKNILAFLSKPDESFLRSSASMPVSLSDVEIDDIDDFCDMSDSDTEITCEVVEKKVECITLVSSGEESDGEGKPRKSKNSSPMKKNTTVSTTKTPTVNATTVSTVNISNLVTPSQTAASSTPVNASASEIRPDTTGAKRTLGNFETICKIVNTHPHEYLVDIFELLYLKKHEPQTLRKDILDFSGFTFEMKSPEYIKRKQLLDRMLYNSVRRIYNTLIHNTTEVKVFSKPTMITEIFQFLFNLPDHDTSVRPQTASKPSTKSIIPGFSAAKNYSVASPSPAGINLPNLTGKLSDLKRGNSLNSFI
ncbi:protein DEK [Trichonephila clavipes]|nr:protein DEK [Trichonephila clavipes]